MLYMGTTNKKSFNSFQRLLTLTLSDEWPNYDFSQAEYRNNTTKMLVICKYHGEVWIRPKHLLTGVGCKQCGVIRTQNATRKTIEQYDSELLEAHKGTIKRLGLYRTAATKIPHKHICGYEWDVRPNDLLNNHGCPCCSQGGFNPKLPAILYYISIDNGRAYKIGITNRSVKARFSKSEFKRIDIIKSWDFVVGQDALNHEQRILKEYKWAKYTGDKLLGSGNTELFYTDILYLDERIRQI